MKTYVSSSQENEQQSVANRPPKKQNSYGSRLQFADNRPEAIAQMKLHETINNSHKVRQLKNIQENVNSKPLMQKVSVIQRVDIGTVASNFILTKKGANADIWTSNDGKWHFSYYRNSGDYHIKGNGAAYKPFQKGTFNGVYEERTENQHKKASADAIMSGNMFYWIAEQNVVPLYR